MGAPMGRKLAGNISTDKPINLYHWELVLEHGIINQLNELERPESGRLDPQKPPPAFGRPLTIHLVPHKDHLSALSMAIPITATPVCFKLMVTVVHRGDDVAGGVVAFAIGYRVGNDRTMKFVDPVSGEMRDVCDTVKASGQ